MRQPVLKTLTATFVLVPTVVLAHTGHTDANGFMHGFTHPITGIDHLLAMVAVGALAARLGRSGRCLAPLTFIAVMTVGGALGLSGVSLSVAELAVALSVVVFGLGLALPFKLPTLAVVTVVGLFALFHGQAHGAEMPAMSATLVYTAGFVSATALLHAIGVSLGVLFDSQHGKLGRCIVQAGGGAMALFGIAALAGQL
jgi:urease accessory protein